LVAVPLIHLGVVDSTQSFLLRHPELGFCGVLADAQTAGRGRGDNSWESSPGAGLWLSARLPVVPQSGVLLSAMEAVAEILGPCDVRLGIKWPNDLVAYKAVGQAKTLVKIGGIIGEQKKDCAILGLGLNIHSAPEMPERAIPPASLVSLGVGPIPSIVKLAQSILLAWQDLEAPRQAAFRWPAQGDRIQWEEGSGTCQGWQDDGRLAVQTQTGVVLLASGDVKGMMVELR